MKMFFLLFIIYSFMGWLMEVSLNLITNKKFINRGFLLGPYCPVYGVGCLFLIILLSRYQQEPAALFALAIIICSIVEYFTSWIMEKIFKLRWWDYTNQKFNINGRICLETMVPFGLLGVLIVKYVNPFLIAFLKNIPNVLLNILSILLLIIFVIDVVISSNIVFNFKNIVKTSKKDSTEDIKKFIHNKIKNNKILYNRLINSYPNLKKIINKRIKK